MFNVYKKSFPTQVEALKEQLWELDTANRNNLVFYGVREEGFSPEAAIRDVIKRFEDILVV